ncbi:MAG: hypothetical protein NT094_00540 [Candidatus Staskawiczbacteria bacterium]|nr:hypothetical protein [Candidatus Staskawiczbacteria bacterium]
MKFQKIFFLLFILILAFGFLNSAKAESKTLAGYVYSETAGWISLSCENTNSCNIIDYKVVEDNSRKLSGYGWAQNGGWVNFNPNFGGVNVNYDGVLSGWAYSENNNWLNFDKAKNISAGDLQNEITKAQDLFSSNNLTDDSVASLLNSLCSKFLSNSECATLSN